MGHERLSRRYAIAIFSLAQDAQIVDQIGNELRIVNQLLEGTAEFRDFYRSPILNREAKIAAMKAAFAEKVHSIVLHSLLLLIRKRREVLYAEITRCYEQLARAARGCEKLTITSARPLGPNELAALVERLSNLYKKSFDVQQELDPRLIGGLRVQMGDRRIDGTISGRIEDLAASLYSLS